MIGLALDLGAERIEIAHVQYHGWARLNRAALVPRREEVLEAAAFVDAERERLRGRLQIDHVLPDVYGRRPKPCLGGWGRQFLLVDPCGRVLPCHAAPSIPGLRFDTVSDRPLAWIWESSEAFALYRGEEWMSETCRGCEFKGRDFGGCRCQALAETGNAAEADPVCELSPRHAGMVADVVREAAAPPPAFLYREVKETV